MSDDAVISELQSLLKRQKKAFRRNPNPSIESRKVLLNKVIEMMLSSRKDILQALNDDFGNHPKGTGDIVEIIGQLGRAQYALSKIDEWTKPDIRDTDPQLFGNSTAHMVYSPKGVIGNMVPFNFPYDLSIGPLVDMLAAGNRVIIKPSDSTPACAKQLKSMIGKFFDEDQVAVVVGGTDLSIKFSTLKFDHILYTGSPSVGKLVMKSCAENLTPVTLELGGKCPAIITPGFANEKNVNDIIGIKMLKNGQMCVSVDYVLVHEDDLKMFIDVVEKVNAKIPDYIACDDCCGIITKTHLARIEHILKEAKDSGAQIITIGGEVVPEKRQAPLSVVVNPPNNLTILKEEIFGPILPIIPYKDIQEAIDVVMDGERPLSLYAFGGQDSEDVERIVNETVSGGVSINTCAMQAALPSLGFGGSGNSGFGAHHGIEGFREFSNPRGTFRRGDGQDAIAAFHAPYRTAEAIADGIYKAAGVA